MSNKNQKVNYTGPFIIMVVLMSLVGLITSLNQQFQAPMQAAYLIKGGGMTNFLTTMLVFSFFLAYLVMGPITNKYIDKNGYKKSLVFGLLILIGAFGLYELSAWIFETFDKSNFSATINEAKQISDIYKSVGASATTETSWWQGFIGLFTGGTKPDANLVAEKVAEMKALAAQTGHFSVETVKKTGEFEKLNYIGSFSLSNIPIAYYVFLIAAFVAGTALTFLQAVVNPYIVACDVKGTSGVQRQSIAGAGNSTMTTIGPLLVASLIFAGASGLDISISSLYVPIFVLIVLVSAIVLILQKVQLPSIASAEKKEGEVLEKSVWSFSHLRLGVVAIFVYVGVEVAVGSNINLFAMSEGFSLGAAAKLASFYWGGMLIGRLLGSGLSKVSANAQLVVASAGAGILVILGMITNNPAILIGVGLFHSIMWPAIFSLAINKLGKYTSAGTGALMMGVVGGAVLPLVQGIAADMIGWQWTWIIVVISEAYLLYYALLGYKVKQSAE